MLHSFVARHMSAATTTAAQDLLNRLEKVEKAMSPKLGEEEPEDKLYRAAQLQAPEVMLAPPTFTNKLVTKTERGTTSWQQQHLYKRVRKENWPND